MKLRLAFICVFFSFLSIASVFCNDSAKNDGDAASPDSGADAELQADAADGGLDATQPTDAATIDSGESDSGTADSGATDAGHVDGGPDASKDSGAGDAGAADASDGGTDASQVVEFPPDKWGKYPAGYYKEDLLYDSDRKRVVPFHIWYPALAPGAKKVNYLLSSIGLLSGNAYENVAPAKADGPFPVILFSHGFKGIAFQSFSLTEYLASHGFIVVAPNHQGNTLLDFTSSKEDVANVTMLRPGDVGFVYAKAVEYAKKSGHVLEGLVDETKVAMTGHSFGAFTAIIVSGAQADMDRAKAACAAGVEADVMCPYVGYYAAGTVLKMDPKIPGLKALVALAPGGYNAIFDDNLAKVYVPSMVMGGTEDNTCPLDIETRPIYGGLPTPKRLSEIFGASHMSFTNVCTIPLIGDLIGDMCIMSIKEERAFEIINTLTTAYIRRHLLGETAMDRYLTLDYINKTFTEVKWTED